MKSVIFAGGDYKLPKFYKDVLKFFDLKIAADSGANFLIKHGVLPDILIGDMDSVRADVFDLCKRNKVEIIKFPTAKDEIDTELALMEAQKRGSQVFFIAGAFGTRLDQTLGVFRLMERFRGSITFNEDLCSFVIDHPLYLNSNIGERWSVIPLQKDVEKVSLRGFKYDLDEKKMEYLRPYGISNESMGKEVFIDPGNGRLLVFRYHLKNVEWINELYSKLK